MSLFSVPNHLRIIHGDYANNASWGNNGHFSIVLSGVDEPFLVKAIWDWSGEQLAVSHPDHRPTYDDLDLIKDLFWNERCVVYQMFQPAKSRDWWSIDKYTAHLFRRDGHRYGSFDVIGPNKSMRLPLGVFSEWPRSMDCDGYKAWKK